MRSLRRVGGRKGGGGPLCRVCDRESPTVDMRGTWKDRRKGIEEGKWGWRRWKRKMPRRSGGAARHDTVIILGGLHEIRGFIGV